MHLNSGLREVSVDSRTPMAPTCGVCGASTLVHDAVEDRGLWLIASCERCDHRWIASATEPAVSAILTQERLSVPGMRRTRRRASAA
jgi:hypothetical protein